MARLVLFIVSCLLAQAFCVPAGRRPGNRNRPLRADNEADSEMNNNQSYDAQTTSSTSSYDNDDDEDFDDVMQASPSTGGGSNIMSLLNLATALFPSASGATLETMIRGMIRQYFIRNPVILRRQDIADNVIEIDYVNKLTPPFQRQEDESHDTHESNSNSHDDDDDDDDDDHDGDDDNDDNDDDDDDNDSDNHDDNDDHNDNDNHDDGSDSKENNNAAEESMEDNVNENDKASKQDSGLNDDDDNGDDNDSDYSDEPPGGGDGQGGGVLGLLAGLSGGEDGQSDLGSLLAAVSGIVGSLSGDGFDLNALIATGFGLFVGLLSEGEENPGAVIASYLLTSLDTITGGGSKNNGAYFGSFLSKLIKGTSAVSDESGSDEENGNKMPMTDSTGFFVSLLMSLSGDMSKGSSGGSSAWRR